MRDFSMLSKPGEEQLETIGRKSMYENIGYHPDS
jgi:hypothetical protein